MAVAVKNTPEVASSGLLSRMPVVSILGAVYALGCLGIIFSVLPALWQMLPWGGESFVSMTLLGLLMLASAFGLIVGGGRLLAPRALPGARAGIFVCLAGFVVILLLTRWASLWVEYAVYDAGTFGLKAGAILTAAVAVALLFAGGRLLFRPRTERLLIGLEQQGWFSARPYKPLQGLRVRRGTIFGILLLAGCGIYTLMSHNTLQRGPADWQIWVPFTEQVTVDNPGDATFPGWDGTGEATVDRATLNEVNAKVDPKTYVRLTVADEPDLDPNVWKRGAIVQRSEYEAELKRLGADAALKAVPTVPATGTMSAAAITLLPALAFTVPLLLLAASLWLAWRVVNLPVFADFLIATDAEMNKVSWITQRRLVQDTIVVLLTVVLMAGYLFVMDQTWRVVLSWKPIGVLVIPPDDETNTANIEDRPW